MTLGMDRPLQAVAPGRPRPREDSGEVEPAAAEVVGEDEVLPRLVVLDSVSGLRENRESRQDQGLEGSGCPTTPGTGPALS